MAQETVEIEVSGACYYELRRELVRHGKGGTIVERSDTRTIEMSGVTVRLGKRDPMDAEGIRQKLEMIRNAAMPHQGTLSKNAKQALDLAAGQAFIDLAEMLLGDLHSLAVRPRGPSI